MAKKRKRSRGESSSLVSRRAALGLLFTGGAAAAGVQGTGAFSSVAGDRTFSIGTADDSNALLGIESNDPTGDSGSTVTLLTLTNRFSEPITFDQITVLAAGGTGIGQTDLVVGQWTLQPGDTTTVDTELTCSTGVTGDVELAIQAVSTARDESVELRRTTTVTCEATRRSCLSGPAIELEGDTVPCIDVAPQGRGDVEIEAENTTIDGNTTVSLQGGGDVDISLENSVIQDSLEIDIRGGDGSEVEISVANSTITGSIQVTIAGQGEVGIALGSSTVSGDISVDTNGEIEYEAEESTVGGTHP